MDFLLVCKPDSPTLLYAWIDDPYGTRSSAPAGTVSDTWEHYRYANQVPLRDSDDALMVNWCELTLTHAKGEVVFHNASSAYRR